MDESKSTLTIPLTYANEQQSLRLLELPSDLLAIFESQHDNVSPLLIKSAVPNESRDSAIEPAETYHAVLCTSEKTYQLKQVQTSNTVFLARIPLRGERSSLNTFATCSSTLETQIVTESGLGKLKSAEEWLISKLPLYNLDSDLPGLPEGKMALYDDIPFSEEECEVAWSKLAAFERNQGCYRPASDTLVRMWRHMFECHVANSDLAASEQVQLMGRQLLDDLECPIELTEIVLAKTVAAGEVKSAKGPFDVQNTIQFVADILERGDDSFSYMEIDGMRARLDSLLPDSWHSLVTSEEVIKLKERCSLREQRRVEREKVVTGMGDDSDSAKKAVGAPGKRNWHERLKRIKK